MWIKMQHVTTHGDGRLVPKGDTPKELRPSPVARHGSTHSVLGLAALEPLDYIAESDRALISWREQIGARPNQTSR